ncbi:hypothetical protein DFP72DRAFT_851200 [Ephemerocybe angulata]|uniref:Uncharacterized protein n=1 Tax=Ephemerocybe angulata TaxID=980116 RepID=A0A8H6HSE9_9AGAR|nr:hypothetical protein DFP72DRAFT_851200 [Tulosesus angulatus]
MSQYRSYPAAWRTAGGWTYRDPQPREVRQLLDFPDKRGGLGIYLLKKADEGNLKVLEVALRSVDAKLAPPGIAYNLETAEQRRTREENCQNAVAGMLDVAKICVGFKDYEEFGPQLSYSPEHAGLVTFALRAPAADNPTGLISVALDCFYAIMNDIPIRDDWKTELLEQPETIDCFFVYFMLYEKLQTTEYRAHLPIRESLSRILGLYLTGPPHLHTTFITRILSVSKTARETILTSLISHAVGGMEDQFAENRENLCATAGILATYSTFSAVVIQDSRSFAMFYRHQLFNKLFEAFFVAAKRYAAWHSLHPAQHLPWGTISTAFFELFQAIIEKHDAPKLVLGAIKHNAIPCALICMAQSDLLAPGNNILACLNQCSHYLRVYLTNTSMYNAGPGELEQILTTSRVLRRITSNPLWSPIWDKILRKNVLFSLNRGPWAGFKPGKFES